MSRRVTSISTVSIVVHTTIERCLFSDSTSPQFTPRSLAPTVRPPPPGSAIRSPPCLSDPHRYLCILFPPVGEGGMDFDSAQDLFKRTLATERDRPDVHSAMLKLAQPDTIGAASTPIQQALARGERVWMTADLHLCHANVIRYCNRPFIDVTQMNEHLVSQAQKIRDGEWL
eukprot:gene48544-65888_t